jgi:hypothetical protein
MTWNSPFIFIWPIHMLVYRFYLWLRLSLEL